jgi:hypothetical protein
MPENQEPSAGAHLRSLRSQEKIRTEIPNAEYQFTVREIKKRPYSRPTNAQPGLDG